MSVLRELEDERHTIANINARLYAFEADRRRKLNTAIEFILLATVWSVLGFAIALIM